MPKPVREDSGYHESVLSEDEHNDKDVFQNNSITRALEEKQESRSRSPSISSVRSHVSQTSSYLWEGYDPPDSDELEEIQKKERSFSEESTSTWQSGVPSKSSHSLQSSALADLSIEDRDHDLGNQDTNDIHVNQETPRPPRRITKNPSSQRPDDDAISVKTADETNDIFELTNTSSTTRPPVIIAHSDHHQRYFDRSGVSWGVEWEIARLVSSGKLRYEDIEVSLIGRLTGPNAIAAPLVEELLYQDSRTHQAYEEVFRNELKTESLWSELDREEEALSKNPLSGLGNTNTEENWYGGKIHFVVNLRQRESVCLKGSDILPQYYLELDYPQISSSTHFTRRWGSRRFLRIRIPESTLYQNQKDNGLVQYFKNDFIIHKRVFRPFYAKDHSVFMLEIDSIYTNGRVVSDPCEGKVSFDQFLEWHNPMQLNQNQSLAKWCARMALGLSNSVPGVELAADNIHKIDDLYSTSGLSSIQLGRKPESKDILTDGCGFCNLAVLVATKLKYNWERVPCAIQYRLNGSKGLLLLHPDDNVSSDESFRVWIRPSQEKINHDPNSPPDRAHLIMDVLQKPKFKYPARLSTEIIINLAHNGVSHGVFSGLMVKGINELAADLTRWTGPYSMQSLWSAVARANGSVIHTRMSREAGGAARVLGFTARDAEANDMEDKDDIDVAQPRSKAWWPDEISGCPSSLGETVMVLLDSGFEPQSCALLAMKLKEVLKKCINSYIKNYKIVVPHSAEAWIVPDPYGILAPGEIFLKTSENVIGSDGLICDHLLGDVLIFEVTRHPCRVPSDIQKVRAVWKDQLRIYNDVIVLSVKGERSLASMLGGGDYDGDTAHIIWEPSIVSAFSNADNKFADPPLGLENAFVKDTLTVKDFLWEHSNQNSFTSTTSDLQEYLLCALKDVSLIGQYSYWHDTAVFKHGYEHDEAWRLAYMFCTVLDSSKTGKMVKEEVLRRDSLSYNGHLPEWRKQMLKEDSAGLPPQDEAARRSDTMEFIMDYLSRCGDEQFNHHMKEYESFLKSAREKYKASQGIAKGGLYVDPALEAPWLQALERAQTLSSLGEHRMQSELDVIRQHVEEVRNEHKERVVLDSGGKKRQTNPRKGKAAPFTEKPIEVRQDILRELSLDFSQTPGSENFLFLSPEDVRRFRASCAYVLATEEQEKKWTQTYDKCSRFPFDVAMRELCSIKAESIGPYKTVNSQFYSVLNVTNAIQAFRPDGPPYVYSL